MSDHDLNELRRGLQAVPDAAHRLLRRVETLHSLAFDRHVGGTQEGRSNRTDWALDDVGLSDAKELWRRILKMTHAAIVDFEAACVAVGDLLSAGHPPDSTMRGTLLGDEQESATAELARLVRYQRQRAERQEFSPPNEWPQPKVPGR